MILGLFAFIVGLATWLSGVGSLLVAESSGGSLGETLVKGVASVVALALSFAITAGVAALAKKMNFDVTDKQKKWIRQGAYEIVMAVEQKALSKMRAGKKVDSAVDKKKTAMRKLLTRHPDLDADEANDLVEAAVAGLNGVAVLPGKLVEAVKD